MSFISNALGGQAQTSNAMQYTGGASITPDQQKAVDAMNSMGIPGADQLKQKFLQQSGAEQAQNQLNQEVQGQNQLVGQLQTQATGGGPSVATQALKNAVAQNTASANAQAASQRGINPGLAARNAMETSGNMNQAAAGQAAAARMQEQLNAQQQLGGMLNTQVGQSEQASQFNAGQANQMANANAQRSQSAAGGFLSGAASAVGLAKGGKVPNKALPHFYDGTSYIPNTVIPTLEGSDTNPFSNPGKSPTKPSVTAQNTPQGAPGAPMGTATVMGDRPAPVAMNQPMGPQAAPQGPQSFIGKAVNLVGKIPDTIGKLGQGVASEVGKTGQDLQSLFASGAKSKDDDSEAKVYAHPDQGTINGETGDQVISKAKGGMVPAMVSKGERYLPPSEVKKVEKGEKSPMKAGEKISGKPAYTGDDRRNDTVYKKLRAGGVVIPNSITLSPDAERKAKAFMAALKSKREK